MKLARYVGGGRVQIVDEPAPECPEGGLLVQTEASGLCSGELMDWYMDRKIPHVLGHEVAGRILISKNSRFTPGQRVFAHHHAPCMQCDLCQQELFVHCDQWKRTKLIPGGMAETFAVPAENLTDTFAVDELRAIDAALIEPLACVMKSLRLAQPADVHSAAVIGRGVMGLMHCLVLENAVGIDHSESRVAWARKQGIDARLPQELPDGLRFDRIFVCPGSQSAFDSALSIAKPGARLVNFAPLPPTECLKLPQSVYFHDLQIVHSYSCGPDDTKAAMEILLFGRIRAESVVSDFIRIEELPRYYELMKTGKILKPMVIFDSPGDTSTLLDVKGVGA